MKFCKFQAVLFPNLAAGILFDLNCAKFLVVFWTNLSWQYEEYNVHENSSSVKINNDLPPQKNVKGNSKKIYKKY